MNVLKPTAILLAVLGLVFLISGIVMGMQAPGKNNPLAAGSTMLGGLGLLLIMIDLPILSWVSFLEREDNEKIRRSREWLRKLGWVTPGMKTDEGKKPVFRYDTTHTWFKGNTHIHSTRSDGGMELAEIAKLYASDGYDFLFATDHMVPSDFASEPDRANDPLLWIDGVELHGTSDAGAFYHVVCLGKVEGVTPETPFPDALRIARASGALRILAHPLWTGNTLDDALAIHFDGVEIYNHVCRWLNGKDDGRAHWYAMLDSNPAVLAFASDDAHLKPEHPGHNGGWVMVNAPECTPEAILDAIRRGNTYSTTGPDFHTIQLEGRTVRIETSPIRFARLVGPKWNSARTGDFENDFTSAEFEIPEKWPYATLEIEDASGKRAWSNPLFA